ncbi:unnamed protein product [Bursaphelenchus xylophilus]|uniref:(pine wood nematode) hypothetical protein n=1 Tax=Bursaphelenchus xylophilus TaxID=6326 RepID=A0A1I7RU04_BURXY|nr:unnamed protein product [Bursaphelenchus xylophilus]CAG9132047.1 unnamed protein product [Bursaphelenchus xylophilus]
MSVDFENSSKGVATATSSLILDGGDSVVLPPIIRLWSFLAFGADRSGLGSGVELLDMANSLDSGVFVNEFVWGKNLTIRRKVE